MGPGSEIMMMITRSPELADPGNCGSESLFHTHRGQGDGGLHKPLSNQTACADIVIAFIITAKYEWHN